MPGNQRIVIWGAGGHAKVIADIIRRGGQFEIAGFLDDGQPDRVGTEYYGATILGGVDRLPQLLGEQIQHMAIALGDNYLRLNKADAAEQAGFTLPALIDPSAVIAESVSVGAGVVIGAGAIINGDAKLLRCAIVNSGAIVEHDCIVSDGVHIAPGVALSGEVTVGSCTMIGTGSSVRNRIRIGRSSIIGVGSAVVCDIPDDVIAFGVPARVVRSTLRT